MRRMGMDPGEAARINLDNEDWVGDRVPIAQHSLYRKIDRIVSAMPPGRVLELGCGPGHYLEQLRPRGWDAVGVDIRPQHSPYIHAFDLSGPLPFEHEFDLVITAETIEHVVDTRAFLANCQKVLKPSGTLILTTPNLLFGVNRIRMLFGRRPAFAYADYHVRMFVWSDLRAKIGEFFTIESVRGSHVLIGVRKWRAAEVFSVLGDRLPSLSAHFIVVAKSRFE
jgi:SAM-dependent methyltransferase